MSNYNGDSSPSRLPSSWSQPSSLLMELRCSAEDMWSSGTLGCHYTISTRVLSPELRALHSTSVWKEREITFLGPKPSLSSGNLGGRDQQAVFYLKFSRWLWSKLKLESLCSKSVTASLFPLPMTGWGWAKPWTHQSAQEGSDFLYHRRAKRQQNHPSYFRLKMLSYTYVADSQLPCNHSVMLGDELKHQASKQRVTGVKTERAWSLLGLMSCQQPLRNMASPDSLLNNVLLKTLCENSFWLAFC